MAQFAPYTPQNPQYLPTNTKEPDKIKPNTAMKSLFEGIGEAFSTAVEGIDTLNQQGIQKESYTETDKIYNEEIGQMEKGLGLTTPETPEAPPIDPAQPATLENAPPNLASDLKGFQRLASAAEVRADRRVEIEGRMHELAQRLNAKYGPGYRPIIEASMDRARNTQLGRYHNALKAATLAGLASQKSEDDKYDAFITNNAQYFLEPENLQQARAAKTPEDREQFKNFVGNQKIFERNKEEEDKNIQRERANNTLTNERAFQAASKRFDDNMSNEVAKFRFNLGDRTYSYDEFRGIMNRMQMSGKPIDRELLAKAGAQLGVLKSLIIDKTMAELNKQGSTSILTNDQIKSLGGKFDVVFSRMTAHLGAGNMDAITSDLTNMSAIKNNDYVRAIYNNKYLRAISTLDTVVGPSGQKISENIIQQRIDLGKGKFTTIQQEAAIALHNMRGTIIAGNGEGSLITSIEEFRQAIPQVDQPDGKKAAVPPGFVRGAIETPQAIVANPNAPKLAKDNSIKVLSDTEGNVKFIQEFQPEQQMGAVAKILPPAHVDNVWKEAQGNRAQWEKFKETGVRMFEKAYQTEIQTMNQAIQDARGLNVRLNPETMQYEYQNVVSGRPVAPGTRQGNWPQDQGQPATGVRGVAPTDAATKAIDRINLGLKSLKYMYEKDGSKLTPADLRAYGLPSASANPVLQKIIFATNQEQAIQTAEGAQSTDAWAGVPTNPQGGVNPGAPATQVAEGSQNRTQEAPTAPGGTPIDPNKPQIQNPDGTVSTERTITIEGKDGGWVNIPTIVDGKQMTPEQAEAAYLRGKNNPVGTFNTVDEAKGAAQQRSDSIGQQIQQQPAAPGPRSELQVLAEKYPQLRELGYVATGNETPAKALTPEQQKELATNRPGESELQKMQRVFPELRNIQGSNIRSQYAPTPRNYGDIRLPYSVPGMMKDQVIARIQDAGIDVASLPKGIRDKLDKAGFFSNLEITKEDLDSLSDGQWRQLASKIGAPNPGVTPKETIELASSAPQANSLPAEIQKEVLNPATVASGPLTLEEPKGKPKSTYTPIEVAKRFEGMHERTHTKTIADFIRKAAGTKINPATTAWCAAFLNAVLGETGREGTGSNMARSFLKYGTPTKNPTQGDIVVLSRGKAPYGHVGLLVSQTEDKVSILGGNQSHKVSVQEFPKSMVLGYRKPDKDVQVSQVQRSGDINSLPEDIGNMPVREGAFNELVEGQEPSTNIDDRRAQNTPENNPTMARIQKIMRDPSMSAGEKQREIENLSADPQFPKPKTDESEKMLQAGRDLQAEESDLADALSEGLTPKRRRASR